MLNIVVSILLCVVLFFGCARTKKDPAVAIKIGSISMNPIEFEKAFKDSPYSVSDTPEARREFMENYITRMLILKEAEEKGLNKDKEFLQNVELFWQQSLIRMMLDKKARELSTDSGVSDNEIKSYYDAHQEGEFKGKGLGTVYNNIKWIILSNRHQKLMDAWLDSLRKSSRVDINYSLLEAGR